MSDSKAEIFVEKQAPKVSRRDFLKGVATVAGIGATGGLTFKAMETLANTNKSIQGQYLTRDKEGKFHATNEPQIVQVSFSPTLNPDSKGKITFRLGNPNEGSEEKSMPPSEIKTQFAARMAGSGFSGQNQTYARIDVFNPNRNEMEKVGVWFKLTNKEGQNVDPQGNVLKENEKPRFAAANFASVISELNLQTPSQK